MIQAFHVPAQVRLLLSGYAWWLIFPLAALLAHAIVKLYRRESEPHASLGRWLRRLRAAVVVLLTLLLSQPIIHRIYATYQAPLVLVLRDASTSMSVRDRHEALARRVRAAAALRLLDPKRRDTRAEQAEGEIQAAQRAAGAARAGLRQAAQLLQEGGADVEAVRNEVRTAGKRLAEAGDKSGAAAALLEKAPQAQALRKDLQKRRQGAARLETELAETPLEGAEGSRRLLDKVRLLKVLAKDLGKLRARARAAQDRADRALGQSKEPEVVRALATLARMDRRARVAAMLKKRILPENGARLKIVSYDFDTRLHVRTDQEAKADEAKEPEADSSQAESAPPPPPPSSPSGNLLLAKDGARASGCQHAERLIDGDTTHYDGGSGFADYDLQSQKNGAMLVTLPAPVELDRLRILLWDKDNRRYRYIASVSPHGKKWITVKDASKTDERSWQEIRFPLQPVQAVRVKGVHNSANSGFHVVEIEGYRDAPNPPLAKERVAAEKRTETDLATPLLSLGERYGQERVAAVVVFSDGRHTTGPLPQEAARALAARGTALYTVAVGSPEAPPDLCVARLDGTRSVFLDETIKLTAHVKASGFPGRSCRLVLRRGKRVVAQRTLKLGADGWRREVFELRAEQRGPNVFRAEIEPLAGEALATNNRAEMVVDVAHDRLKVLAVDERPRWETRYVANLLRRERKMRLDEHWLLSADLQGPKRPALPDTQKELDEYDIVVLGDVPAGRMDKAAQKRLARYVSERGGFLVLIAGRRSMPWSYLAGPVSELLPITLKGRLKPATPLRLSGEKGSWVRVKLSADAGRYEMVRVLHDPVLNEKLWPALPELPWVARPAYAKPGATPLLVTDDARRDVVAAVHHFGAGRVLYVGTNSTWRWRFKVAERVHAVFWAQAMRWGTSNRLVGGARLRVGAGRRQIRPGEDLEVLARPRDAKGRAVPKAVVAAQWNDGAHRQRVALQPVPGGAGLYRGMFQNVPAGIHTIRFTVESPGFEGVEEKLQIIAREGAGQEGVELARDTARLAAMAQAGNGRLADFLDAPRLFAQLSAEGKERETESAYELWSSYPALVLIVLLLVIEWILRKRLGLA